MKLLLDVGNTRLKWACWSGDLMQGSLSPQQALPLSSLPSGSWTQSPLAESWLRMGRPDEVWLSNVAGTRLASNIADGVAQLWSLPVHHVVSSAQCAVAGRTIRNAYAQPQQLGVDRWLGLLAAAADNRRDTLLVVSVGTAMTLDVLLSDGQHAGGLIVPGPQLMVDALLKRTSDIAERASESAASTPAATLDALSDHTHGCVINGAHQTSVALIERLFARYQSNAATTSGPGHTHLYLTGGAAPGLLPSLTVPVTHMPDLVLRGLAVHAAVSATSN